MQYALKHGLKMSLNQVCLIFGLMVSIYPSCSGLATGAVYVIKNEGTKQCLTAGPIIKMKDMPVTLFKEGVAISAECANLNNRTTEDYLQEWTIRLQRENPRKNTYRVQLIMRNAVYKDVDLKLKLRGEFVAYFPPSIVLAGIKSFDAKTQSQLFSIIDPETNMCLADISYRQRVTFLNCNPNELKQRWRFTLINQIELVKESMKQMH